jgi:hypothetical protein
MPKLLKCKYFTFLLIILLSCNRPVVTLPFEITRDIIFIKLKVNEQDSLDFIFDTGQFTATIDSTLFDSLKMKAFDTITVNCISSIKRSFLTRCKYTIGPIVLDTLVTYVTPFKKYRKSLKRRVDGIIGYDIIKNNIIHIDYDNQVIEIYDTATKKKWPGTLFALNDTVAPAIMAETTMLNGFKLIGNYVLDCGSNSGITISASLIDTSRLLDFITDTIIKRYVSTCGKSSKAIDGIAQSFRIGPYILDNIPVSVTTSKSGVLAEGKYTGLIGTQILKYFNVVINCKKKIVYIETTEEYKKKKGSY